VKRQVKRAEWGEFVHVADVQKNKGDAVTTLEASASVRHLIKVLGEDCPVLHHDLKRTAINGSERPLERGAHGGRGRLADLRLRPRGRKLDLGSSGSG